MIAYNKLDKLKNAIRDNFEELRIEVTEEEIEKRIEAVKKEIDDIWKLQQTFKDKKKYLGGRKNENKLCKRK